VISEDHLSSQLQSDYIFLTAKSHPYLNISTWRDMGEVKYNFVLCATGDAGEKGTFVSIIILNILFRQ
jgi:hypothetical protein